MFITVEELKQTVLNANIDAEYIQPAIGEAEDVYLREILGDALYNELASQINNNALIGNYATLVNSYIKPYLTYKVQSILVVPINFKMRNAGVISQYDQGFTTSNVKDTAYLADHYNSRAEFYANRLTTYLQQNNADFPEYGYSDENVTNPVTSQNATTLYLGGTRKKCNCNGRSSGGSSSSVDWNDIRNKPDFANVATSGDYFDLKNQPNIPESPVQSDWNETDTNSLAYIKNKPAVPSGQVQSDWNQTNNQAADYIKNKPTKVSDFTNDAGYLTEHQDLTGYATEQWVSNQGYSTFSGLYNDLSGKPNLATVATSGDYNDLQNKPNIPTVNNATLTIKQGGTTKGTFTANAGTDVEINLEAGGSGGSTDWSDITNKPNFATVATSGDYDDLTNKPTIPTVPTNVSAFTNDAGYTTFDGDYNSLTNKPTIPAAQVNSDWNASTGVSQILNKPSLATVATSGSYNDLTNKPTIPSAPVQSDWNESDTSSLAYIANKPTIPTAQVNSDWNSNSGVSQILNKPSLATVATSGNYSDLNGTPSLATVATSGDYDDLQNKPTIPAAPVQSDWNEADSSSLAYIANKPTIPAAQVNSDWNAVSGVAQILNKPTIPTKTSELTNDSGFTTFDGDYNSLTNKPTIPAAQVQTDWNAVSGMGQLLNKPTMTSETWTFSVDNGQGGTTTVTKKVWLEQ